MNQTTLVLPARLLLLALAALGGGCVATSPHADSQFGQSVRAAVALQTADPAAVRNTNPVSGMDGPAARAAQHKYEASFATPAPADPGMLSDARR
jgi:hypothetical protein